MILLLQDPCYQVRAKFAQKLHKGLLSLRLPLKYMSIYALAANDPLKERKTEVKQNLVTNINKRREYLRQHPNNKCRLIMLFTGILRTCNYYIKSMISWLNFKSCGLQYLLIKKCILLCRQCIKN